jgi:hypothetical protein
MAWLTLTSTLAAERMAEFSALKDAALAETQDADDIIDACCARIAAKVQGYVAANSKNTVGPGGTIPEELEDAALALLVPHIIARIPALNYLMDDTRKTAQRDAIELLKDTARGHFAVSQPTTPADEQFNGGGVSLVNAPDRQFTREKMSGLL